MKKIIIAVIASVILLLLIPIPVKIKDGGTIHYNAILYDVYDIHRVTTPDDFNDAIIGNEYIEGIIVEIFGIQIFNNTTPHIDN